jgi:hypothetical protein
MCETVDHLIWHCGRFETERRRLTDVLPVLDVQLGPPVRDLCAQKKWRAMKCSLNFLPDFGIRIWWLGCPRIAGQIISRTLDGLGQWSNWKTCNFYKIAEVIQPPERCPILTDSVDHLIWHCERFRLDRHRLIGALAALNASIGIPIRDLCALKKWWLGIKLWWFGLLLYLKGWKFVHSDLKWLRPVVQ